VEANSTGGQGSRRAVAPSDDEFVVHPASHNSMACSLDRCCGMERKAAKKVIEPSPDRSEISGECEIFQMFW
jgi:hypothetical protein